MAHDLYYKISGSTCYYRNTSASGYTKASLPLTTSTSPANGKEINFESGAGTFYLPENPSYIFYNATSIYIPTYEYGVTIDASECKTFEHLFHSYVGSNLFRIKTQEISTMVSNKLTIGIKNIQSNITSIEAMFYNCTALTSLDLSDGDTSSVTIMTGMFYNCSALTSVDLSSFNTSNVTNMAHMFYNCKDLTSLDLSNGDISKVTSMYFMFNTCTNLKTIYVSNDGTTSAVTTSNYMFSGCPSIVGGAGTTYNSSYVDKTAAVIDKNVSGTWGTDKGYLTRAVTTNLFKKVNGSGVEAVLYKKVSGAGKEASLFKKVNGTWKS